MLYVPRFVRKIEGIFAMDDFNKSMFQTLEWMSDLVYQGCENLFLDFEDAMVDLEATVDTYLEPVFVWLDEVDEIIINTSRPFIQTVTPTLQDHPACVGCCNYHGESYDGNMLVCAMHPYGADGLNCSDWESVWKNDPDL
jgi:hypothetical protein